MNSFLSRVLLIGIVLLSFSKQGFGQRYTNQDYIKLYGDLAVKEMKRVGIPASITLAQGMLESQNGNSNLARKSNNHFGIKCHSDWKGKKVYHDDDKKGECFRKYKSVYNSYMDHSAFLTGKKRYASLFTLKTTDYKGWAHGLRKAGYATDPKYAKKLIKLIEDNQLHKYDKGLVVVKSKKKTTNKPKVSGGINDNFVINTLVSHKLGVNNGVKYIKIQEDDNFLDICSEYGLKEWEIFAYNDLNKGSRIKDYKYLYVQPKRNRAHKKHKVHRVKSGETLHYISQKYGVKLKRLSRYNSLDKNAKLNKSQIINLRRKKKKK